ncbi:MAG: PKD domain-containing protein [Candidatus Cloacimonetes bacterium]|nr:PKD domain-containing protein [Candidatus Cloacimonadota bacterium]
MKKVIVVLFVIMISNLYSTIINIPEDQPTIQAGIIISADGDTILVQPGTYYENINYNGQNVVVGSLFLTSQDTSYISQTVIDGSQVGSVVMFESGETSSAVLSGFTIRNGYASGSTYPDNRGGGISIDCSSPTLNNLIVTDNQAINAGGISFWDNANATLDRITVINNFSYNNSGGLHFSNSNPILTNVIIKNNFASSKSGAAGFSSCSPTLVNTLIVDNTAMEKGGAIYLSSEACPVFENVTICNNNSSWSAIYCDTNSWPNLLNCILWNNSPSEILLDNGGAISITYSDVRNGWAGIGNINEDPLFINPYIGNYHLQEISPCIDAGDPATPLDPDGTIADMGAYYYDQRFPQAEFTVNDTTGSKYSVFEFTDQSTIGNLGTSIDSWSWDFNNDGVEDSNEQSPCYVYNLPGVYSVSLTVTDNGFEDSIIKEDFIQVRNIIHIPADFESIQEGINVCSNEDTILVHPGIYFENINYSGKNLTIGSLFLTTQNTSCIFQTIVDGSQDGRVVTFENNENSTAVLTGFTIRNGYASGSTYPDNRGGGISIDCSSPTLNNLIVTDNQAINAGGISFWDNANATLDRITVINNFSYNNSGGLHFSNSNPILTNVIIKNNFASSKSGAAGFSSCSPTLINALIVDNTAMEKAGAIYLSSAAYPVLINATIYNNNSSWSAIHCDTNSYPNLFNCVLWNNSPSEVLLDNGGTISINYSNVKNGWGGTGNISTDPLFDNPTNGDYHLSDKSLCVGAGIDSLEINGIWYCSLDSDLDGNSRPNPTGSCPDIGAYENILGVPFDAEIVTIEIIPTPGNVTINETESIDFSFSGYDPNGSDLEYSWEVDDVVVSNDCTYLFTTDVSSAGEYVITLDITDNFGISDTTDKIKQLGRKARPRDSGRSAISFSWNVTVIDIDQNIVVNDLSFADYSGGIWQTIDQTIDEIDSLNFFISANDPDGNILEYNWELDGAVVSSDSTYQFNTDYTSAGEYVVTLEVTDNFGTDRASQGAYRNTLIYTWDIVVNDVDQSIVVIELVPPEGSITIDEEDVINFSIEAFDPDGNDLEYSWRVDGIEESTENTFIFITDENSAGDYVITLSVSDNYGTRDEQTFSWDIHVNDTVNSSSLLLPQISKLFSNHPNPFNPLTTIRFDIKENEKGILSIYNIKGQFIESNQFESGQYHFNWNASGYSSGIYLYKLETKSVIETRKMLLLK